MVICFSLGIGKYLIIIFGPCLSFLRHNRCQIKTVMIEHSIERINSVEHFCSPFLLEAGRGGVHVSRIDCQTSLNIEFVDRDFEKYSFKFGF